ncbi:MAG: glycosyltransferase [Chitinophagaceae bacterium]
MEKALSLIPYKIFPAKLGGQKGIALFNEYLSKLFPLCCATVTGNDPRYATYPVFNILGDSSLRYINVFNFFRLRKIIRDQAVTHLILEHPYLGWLGMLLKKYTGVKLVVHSHNIESTRWKTLGKWWWKILWWYEGMVHRYADYNFFIHDEDRSFAVTEYNVDPAKAITVTYGIEWNQAPSKELRDASREILLSRYTIESSAVIMLFNGSLDYSPNLNAVHDILKNINPLFLQGDLVYRIIICGSGLPREMNDLTSYADKNIIYAGFVDDISLYFKGSDIFLNPVTEGGGIKTKLVEALGYGTRAVSTQNGSIGVNPEECGGNLAIVKDKDWEAFASETRRMVSGETSRLPEGFFKKFYWGNIASKAAEFMRS